jgi:hypothetical protein
MSSVSHLKVFFVLKEHRTTSSIIFFYGPYHWFTLLACVSELTPAVVLKSVLRNLNRVVETFGWWTERYEEDLRIRWPYGTTLY